MEAAQRLANVLEEYLRLREREYMTVTGAARMVGVSASMVCGPGSMLARYQSGGLAGLVRERRAGGQGARAGDLTEWIEGLGWFVLAAKFFYINCNFNSVRGSVPEAVKATLSLPHLPLGWRNDTRFRFEKKLREYLTGAPPVLPTCPPDLRLAILARERAGMPIVPERVARAIKVDSGLVQWHRRPKEAGLHYLTTSGSTMFLRRLGQEAEFVRAGAVLEADDGTINFPVCIPWSFGDLTPDGKCAEKFGVIVGRFQWLRARDVATRYRPGWAFIARPRSSYRGEDVLSLLRALCIQHGIWRQYRFEQGTWKSTLVKDAIKLLGADLVTVRTPRAKPYIEGGFNQDWTKLSLHFPHCDLGRYAGDTEATNKLVQACRAGQQDPRKLFPMLSDAVAAFEQVTTDENQTPVNTQWGSWVPQERWVEQLAREDRLLRPFASQLAYAFCPEVRDWTVHGMNVGGRVRLFEEVSPEFNFNANWLYEWDGARVRLHFDPRDPECLATVVALEARNGRHPGDILGTAQQQNETTGYIRRVLGWGDDDSTLGLRMRQQNAAAMRRELRGVVPNARGYRESEERDGISQVTKVEAEGGNLKSEIRNPKSEVGTRATRSSLQDQFLYEALTETNT